MRLLNLVLATSIALPSTTFANWNLDARIQSSLNFLRVNQTTGAEGYDIGQWKSQVVSNFISAIGVGQMNVPFEEPTAFIASSTANVLAEAYFYDRSLKSIPPMIAKTKRGFDPYKSGAVFHFYPPSTYNGHAVRRPKYMFLKPRWEGFTNTPNDADTTSVSYLTLAYDQAMQNAKGPRTSGFKLPQKALNQLSNARDVNRTPHTYNALHGYAGTGAFLTWLFDEENPQMPRNWFAPPDHGVRIPFNKNDVDCVVNANVIKTLTATGQTNTPGYAETCNYMNKAMKYREYYHCGMYYPSYYAFPYTVAAAKELGATCFEKSAQDDMMWEVLRRQENNGSWKNHWKARPDYVQSTAWAVNTILIMGDPKNPEHREAVMRGLQFLLSQTQQDHQGRHFWSGEVFYAAIFVARLPVVWRSTGYTTALVTKAMVLANKKWGIR